MGHDVLRLVEVQPKKINNNADTVLLSYNGSTGKTQQPASTTED